MKFKTVEEINQDMLSQGLGHQFAAFNHTDPAANWSPEHEDPGLFDYLGDAAMSGPRAGLSTIQGLYELADVVTFDALPDIDLNFMGESQYLPGQIGQVLSEIGLAIASGAGVARGFAALPRIGQFLQKGRIGRSIASGMFADAILTQDSGDLFLGMLVNKYPELSGPLMDFIATNEDDSKAELKLKGALEGLAMGGVAHQVFRGLKMIKAAVRTKGTAEEVTKAIDKAAVETRLKVPEEELAKDIPLEQEEQFLRDSGVDVDQLYDDIDRQFADQEDELAAAIVEDVESPKSMEGAELVEGIEKERALLGRPGGEPGAPPHSQRVNPHKQSDIEKTYSRTHDLTLNLEVHTSSEDFARVERSVERIVHDRQMKNWTRHKVDWYFARNREAIENAYGKPIAHVIAQATANAGSIQEAAATVFAHKQLMHDLSGQYIDTVMYAQKRAGDDTLSELDRAVYAKRAEDLALEMAEFQSMIKGEVFEGSRFMSVQKKVPRGRTSMRGPKGEISPFSPTAEGYASAVEAPITELERQQAKSYLAQKGGFKNVSADIRKKAGLYKRKDTLARGRAIEALNDGSLGKISRVGTTYWIHSLLQRPTTWAVNMATTGANVVVEPLERALGGAMSGQWSEVAAGADQAITTIRNIFSKANIDAAWDTLKTGKPGLVQDASPIDWDAEGQMISEIFNFGPFQAAARLFDSMWSFGSRGLLAGDELFKRADYLSRMEVGLKAQAREMFPGLHRQQQEWTALSMDKSISGKGAMTGEALWREAGDRLANFERGSAKSGRRVPMEFMGPLRQGQKRMFSSPARRNEVQMRLYNEMYDEDFDKLVTESLDETKRATFTNDPAPGTIGYSVKEMINAHPLLRIWMPFVRTPLNIVQHTIDHLNPMGAVATSVKKRFGHDLIGLEKTHNRLAQELGPQATAKTRAQAKGRLATGWGAVLSFSYLANTGVITGKGPPNNAQRAAMMNAGWQPYSIKVGDSYISYQRFAPFATFLGLAADFNDSMRLAGQEEQTVAMSAFTGLMSATAHNLTEQTYLKGLKNLVNILTDPERSGPGVAKQMFGSTIPGGVAMGVSMEDPYMREVRGFMDAWMNRIPGLSDNLEPKRDILGEPVGRRQALGAESIGSFQNLWMPVNYSETSDDFITRELGAIQHGFHPPGIRKNGQNLLEHKSSTGQSAYDRYQELQGRVRVGGRSIRQELGRVMSHPAYQSMPPSASANFESPRANEVNKVLSKYRREAWKQVLREFPQLDAAVSTRKMARRNPYAIL